MYFNKYSKHLVAERFKSAFLESGISQSLLARRSGLTQPQISNILRGKSFPRETTLQKLTYHLRVNYRWVLSGHGRMRFYHDVYPPEEFFIDFSNKLTFAIWFGGYDETRFAESIGTSEVMIDYVIKGTRNPSKNLLRAISKYLQKSEGWLLKEVEDLSTPVIPIT